MGKRRWLAVSAGIVLLLTTAGLVVPLTAVASNPGTGNLTYAHATQVFTQSAALTGVSPAGFEQSRCAVVEPQGCDRIKLNIDPTLNGIVDNQAVVTIDLVPSAGATMSLASFPDGCSPDDVTASCAPYFQGASPWTVPNPGKKTYTYEVVCQVCAAATYKLTVKMKHVDLALNPLPGAGSPDVAFNVQPLSIPPVDGGQLTGQNGEPGIAINRNGYGIVNTFGPTVWVTHDSGQTWSRSYDVYDKDTLCPSGYAADADGAVGIDNVFYADNLCVGTLGGVDNESFTNTHLGDPGAGGANWEGPFVAGGNSDRQWYVTDPKDPGTIYNTYHDFGGPDIEIFKSTDHGHTWFCPITGVPATAAGVPCPVTATNASNGPNPTYPDTGAGNTSARPMIDPLNNQRIYVPYGDTTLANAVIGNSATVDYDLSHLRMAMSKDGGQTWQANTDATGQGFVLDANTAFPYDGANDNTVGHLFISAAIDNQGNLYFVFSVRVSPSTETHLMMISSTDHGLTWSKPARVDTDGIKNNVFPAVTAGDPGRIAMSWYGSQSPDYNNATSLWAEMSAVSTNALAGQPSFTQKRIGGPKEPVHLGDICQVGLNCTASGGNRNLSDYQSIAVDPCGRAHPVWTNDFGPVATVTAIQTSGPLLYAADPCHLQPAAVVVTPVIRQQLPDTAMARLEPPRAIELVALGVAGLLGALALMQALRRRRV